MAGHEDLHNVVTRRGVLTGALLLAGCACIGLDRNEASTPLNSLHQSPDVSIVLSGVLVHDHDIVLVDPGGGVSLVSVGSIPQQADLDAYHLLPNGNALISFDTTVVLPGSLTAKPGDVVRFDGAAYSIQFSAASAGLPAGVNVDAVSMFGSQLLLSFDISVKLNGIQVDDEDLVLYDGTAFTMFFDGSAAGVSPGLDLDSAQYLPHNNHLLLSFDGSGIIGGLSFDDEDLLEFDRVGAWEKSFDGSSQDVAWKAADLDAAYATIVLLGGFVWDDQNADGIRQAGESGHSGVLVRLIDVDLGSIVAARTTPGDGSYNFAVNGSGTYQVQLIPPAGFAPTLSDRGVDDTIDSDVIRVQGITNPIGPPITTPDGTRWGAGVVACSGPNLPVSIDGIRTVTGSSFLIYDLVDPNPEVQATGYNIYRSELPQPPPAPWTLLASDVPDNDPSTPNVQWFDGSGAAPPPGSAWFYQVTAFHHDCGSEGPR